VTHYKVFCRKSLSKVTFERNLACVSWKLSQRCSYSMHWPYRTASGQCGQCGWDTPATPECRTVWAVAANCLILQVH